MREHRSGSSQIAAVRVGALVLCVTAAVAAWALDPDVVRDRLSDDGRLEPFTELWLRRYAFAAAVLAALAGLVTVWAFRPAWGLRALVGRFPRVLPRLALATGGAAAGLVAGELALRAAGGGEGSFSTNTVAYRDYSRTFRERIADQLDGRGYRELRFGRPAASGVPRVLAVGDSFVFGFGVESAGGTYPALLEEALSTGPRAVPCEVLNAGRPGADSHREFAVLRELVPEVRPDLVLIGYYVNDCETTAEKRAFFGARRVLPVLGDNLERVSRLWRLLEGWLMDLAESAGIEERYVDHLRAQAAPGTPEWAEHEAALRRLLRAAGPATVLVIFPLVTDLERYPLDELHAQVAGVARAEGVPVLDLRDALSGVPPEALRVAPWDPHLNERGHALAAEATAAFLLERGLVPGAP